MRDSQTSIEDQYDPGHYEIRIKGHIDNQWGQLFGGLTITLEADGNTLLTGPIIDQTALHSLLKKVRDTGMQLVSVNFVNSGRTIH